MLISTKEKRRKENEKDYCVNALNRAMLISTLWVVSGLRSGIGCQCPQSGDAHFYIILGLVFVLAGACVNALNRAMLISTEVKGNEKTSSGSVNALNRAMLISTNAYKVFCIIVALCVNALNRAMLISTLPFWNWLI